MLISRQASHILLGLGLVLGIVACFLPWSGNEIANLSGFNGSMGNPGILVLVFVGIIGILHFIPFKAAQKGNVFVSIMLVGLILNHLKTAFRMEMASPKVGLFLLLLAGVVLCFTAVIAKR